MRCSPGMIIPGSPHSAHHAFSPGKGKAKPFGASLRFAPCPFQGFRPLWAACVAPGMIIAQGTKGS